MKWIFLVTALLVGSSFVFTQKVLGQIPGLYIDAGANAGFFYTRELGNIKQGNPGFNYNLGIGFYKTDDEKTVFSIELGFPTRQLTRQFFNQDYRYTFIAPDLFIITNHQIGEKFSLEAGLGFAWVESTAGGIFASFPLIPADDFRKWDVMLAAGVEYRLSRIVSVIGRVKWGFVPMLNYQPIGDLGELQQTFNDLFYRSVHLGFRFNLLQKRNE